MTKLRALVALTCAVSLAGCEKNAVQDITKPISGGAFVRFQNYGVNAPGVNFYANEQKVTAISSAACSPPPATPVPACATTGVEAITGVTYGRSANGGNYSMLVPGQYTLSGRIAAAVDNGLAVSSTSATLAEGKFYTYLVSGIYDATTKRTDAFVVEDLLPTTFDYTKAYIRFINASANAPSVSATTTLQGATEVVTVATGLAYKGSSQFVTIAPGLTDFTVIFAGLRFTFTGINLTGGHVFTIVLSGDATSATATGLAINATANR